MSNDTTKLSGSHAAHARLAPSDSKRWTNCTASIAFCEANSHRLPKDTGSVFAREGTIAHDYAADVLLGKLAIEDVPESGHPDFPDTDFRTPVKTYVDHCLSLTEGTKPMVEVSTPLFYDSDSKGTCDFGAVVPHGSGYQIIIEDLKFGQGVAVSPVENTQLAIYALSFVRLLEDVYDFTPDTPVRIGICQPRHREAENQPPWEITLAELEEFCKDIDYKAIQVRTAADRVRGKLPCGERDISCDEILEAAPGAKFDPGEDVCRWCDAKAFCDARLAVCDSAMPDDTSTVDFLSLLPDLTKEDKKQPPQERVTKAAGPLSDEQLVRFYERKKAIESFLSDVEEYLEMLALEGRAVEGTKLVLGRGGNRAWKDQAAADTFLTGQKIPADDRYTKKLITPTQAEKLLADKLEKTRTANRFADLVKRSEPKKVLALSDDKRQAVQADIAAFEKIDEAEDYEV